MRLLALGLLLVALTGCGGPSEAHVGARQVRDGIAVRMTLSATHHGLAVTARIENRRSAPLTLRQDGCGRVGVAELARTNHLPRGRMWTGSVQAVKRLVLRNQASSEAPEGLAPEPAKCAGDGRTRTLTLDPGAMHSERWRVAIRPSLLDAVGSEHALARVKVFEPEQTVPAVQVQQPVSAVAKWPVTHPPGITEAVQFDRLLADPELQQVIAAQPPESWREATVTSFGGQLRLKALSDRYERAFVATARPDGSNVTIKAPGPADRAVAYPFAAADLPPEIRVIPEPKGSIATRDVAAGDVRLPTGRVAVDAYFSKDTPIVDERARPGSYPFRVTLARPVGREGESVALATLKISEQPTARWHYVETIGVDGGTATFSSAEGARQRAGLGSDEWEAAYEEDFDAQTAHGYVADRPLGNGTNGMSFSTGYGDGGYNLFVGLDADGRPTRYVLDCGLLHLAWPKVS